MFDLLIVARSFGYAIPLFVVDYFTGNSFDNWDFDMAFGAGMIAGRGREFDDGKVGGAIFAATMAPEVMRCVDGDPIRYVRSGVKTGTFLVGYAIGRQSKNWW